MKEKPTQTDQINAFNKLFGLISRCPGDWLLKLIEDHSNTTLDASSSQIEAEKHLRLLEQMAVFGSEDAAKSLSQLGCRIAIFLEGLAGGVETDFQKPTKAAEPPNSEMEPRKAYREMSKAVRVLRDADAEELKKIGLGIEEKLNTSYIPLEAHGMFTRKIRFRKSDVTDDKLDTPKPKCLRCMDSGAPIKTGNRLQTYTKSELGSKTAHDEEMSSIAVDYILQCLVERRARRLSMESIRSILSVSTLWPLAVSANQRGRKKMTEERIIELGLGAAPKHTPPPSEKSPAWVLRIFHKLERERSRSPGMTDSHRQEYEADEPTEWLSPTADDLDEMALEGESLVMKMQTSLNLWKRKAAILPPLEKECLSQWVETAMEFLTFVACKDSYYESVEKGSFDRLQERKHFLCEQQQWFDEYGFERSCEKCTTDAAQAAFDCRKSEIIEAFRTSIELEVNLHNKWKSGKEACIQNYRWPSFVENRLRKGQSIKYSLQEIVEKGFESIQANSGI